MADPYVSLDEIKGLVGVSDSDEDFRLNAALTAACASIDEHCGRRFYVDADATAYKFRPAWAGRVELPMDFSTTTGLVVKTDDNDDGTFETTWTIDTDFIVEPLNGLRGGRPWAYDTLTVVGARTFPTCRRRPAVQVTAKWGWPSVPEPVQQAARLLTIANWKRKDAAFGVAGFTEFGAVRVREDPDVVRLLAPFSRPRAA